MLVVAKPTVRANIGATDLTFNFVDAASRLAVLVKHSEEFIHTPIKTNSNFGAVKYYSDSLVNTSPNITGNITTPPKLPGAYFFIVTLLAMAVTGTFSIILSALGLWGLRASSSSTASPTSVEKVMRRLRPIAAGSGASLLIVAPAKPKRRPSPVTLADLTRCRSLRRNARQRLRHRPQHHPPRHPL